MMSTNLIPSMRDTIFLDGKDIFNDIGEVFLDSLFEDGILKDIPIFNTVFALCKTGMNIRERHFLKETFYFIKSFNDGSIDEQKLSDYREMLINDPKRAEKELERVILLLNAHLNNEQSARLGCFYRHYIKKDISWDGFVELSEANSRLFEADFKLLVNLPKEPKEMKERENYMCERLAALGLVQKLSPTVVGSTLEMRSDFYVISAFGKTFLQRIK